MWQRLSGRIHNLSGLDGFIIWKMFGGVDTDIEIQQLLSKCGYNSLEKKILMTGLHISQPPTAEMAKQPH